MLGCIGLRPMYPQGKGFLFRRESNVTGIAPVVAGQRFSQLTQLIGKYEEIAVKMFCVCCWYRAPLQEVPGG